MAPQKGDKQSNTTGENRRCGGEIANFIRKFLRQELFNGKNRRRAVTRIQNAQIYDQEEGNPKREPRQPSNEEAQWNSNRWSERKKERNQNGNQMDGESTVGPNEWHASPKLGAVPSSAGLLLLAPKTSKK